MMEALVTLAEAKEYIRVDGDADNTLISSLLVLAQQHVNDILRFDITAETMDPPIKFAIILLTEHFYEKRDGEDVPSAVLTLLRPYRKAGW